MASGDYIRESSLYSRQLAESLDSGRVMWGGTSTHSSNAFTITLTIPSHRVLVGELFRWIPDASNSGAATLAVVDSDGGSTIAATAIKRADGSTALSSGDIVSGIPVETLYDGTVFRLLSPLGNSGTQIISSGTYTPTLSNIINISSSATGQWQYLRVGATVNFSGPVTIDPSLPGTLTSLSISIPIASNFGAAEDCSGVAFAIAVAGQGAGIHADATTDTAQMDYISGDVNSNIMYCIATYQLI